MPFLETMGKFANEGGMLPEQLWDADDLPEGKMKRGSPTGGHAAVLDARGIGEPGAQLQGRGLF
ncbi:MAG: hypothetical protein B7Z55_00065 [Planctomycetales bacterium 12-60-4]|nr:MAG: hypothetical protein B7Z55_00065 [Planctomycetales bacterium 12-60-4]